jgi:hypothetical protein
MGWLDCWGVNEETDEVGRIRRDVRRKLHFYRDVVTFVVVCGALALADGATGGGWWVQWVAGIWGGFLFLDLLGIFVWPTFWGRDTEDRIVEQDLEKRVVHATPSH